MSTPNIDANDFLREQFAKYEAQQAVQPAMVGVIDFDLPETAQPFQPYEGFLAVAMRAHARGQRVLPICVGEKNPVFAWLNSAIDTDSTERWRDHSEQWIKECAEKYPDAAVCVIAKPFEFCFIDEDSSDEFRRSYEAFAGEPFPKTFTTESRPNHYQSHWLQTDMTRAQGNVSQVKVDGKDFFSFRQHNLYVLSEGSPHPSGTFYHIIDSTLAIRMPDKLVEYMRHLKETSIPADRRKTVIGANGVEIKEEIDASLTGAKIPYGQHDDMLFKIACKIRHHEPDVTGDELSERLVEICEARCEGYGSDWRDMCRAKAHSAMKYEIQDTAVYNNGRNTRKLAEEKKQQAAVAPVQLAEEKKLVESATAVAEPVQYAMTASEIEAEYEKPYPVFLLVEPGGPTWDSDIMYGIAGEIVRKASEYNESHPAGMYLDLLVSMGNIFGRYAHFNVNATQHHTNEFLARVGLSSKSRKGSGRDVIDEIISHVEPKWYQSRVMNGFGSAQAIVDQMRDGMQQQIRNKKTGDFKTVSVPGVDDKRLYIREGELASVFQEAGKPESRADIVLRDGWDGKALNNIVKGKTVDGFSNSLRCAEPHLSISGDTTKAELFAKMPSGAADNGLGNRFLYCYAPRVKQCPLGGPQLDWSQEIIRLYDTVKFAQSQAYVPLTKAAEKMWIRMYMDIENDRPSGLAESMTARGPAHVRRLAMILALLDLSAVIESRHLQAGKRIWDYCQESAEYIFSNCTREQGRILSWVDARGVVTSTQVREELFQKHRKAAWVKAQLDELVKQGRLNQNGDKFESKQRAA